MRNRIGLVLLASVFAGLLAPAAAQAAITVANQNDSGPGSLRAAVEEAPSGETIVLPAGTYTLSTAIAINSKALTIAGHGAGDTILRAGGSASLLVTSGAKVAISGLTFREARTEGPFGAIANLGSEMELRDVVITDNRLIENGAVGNPGGSGAGGGGVFTEGGALTIVDSTVSDNLVQTNGGGGSHGGSSAGAGIDSRFARLTIEGSTIAGNRTEALGGQNAAPNPGQAGGEGAASGLLAITLDETISVTDTTIARNTANASGGPGGEAGQVAAVGAFLATTEGSVKASNLTIAANSGQTLGAPGPEGDAIAGGLLMVSGAHGTGSLLGSTIVENRLEGPAGRTRGGNLLYEGAISLGDTIVAFGSAEPGSENCYMVAPSPSLPNPIDLGFNLESRDQCGFHAAGDQVNAFPTLGPLAPNGGSVETMMPLPGSPAIDKGSRFDLGGDARGVIRPVDFPSLPDAVGGDGSDIGAVEVAPVSRLTLGKISKRPKKGRATVVVTPAKPAAGSLVLKGKGLKTQTIQIGTKWFYKMNLLAKGGAARKLRKKGKLKVRFEVLYSPPGAAPVTRKGSTKLIRVHGKRRKDRHR